MQNIKKIRIGKTIKFNFDITTNGELVSLVGRDIKLVLRNPFGVSKQVPYELTEDTHVVYTFEGKDQHQTGVYWLEVYENKGKENQSVLDFDCVELVPRSKFEN